jgi:hypothetical protein
MKSDTLTTDLREFITAQFIRAIYLYLNNEVKQANEELDLAVCSLFRVWTIPIH